MLQGLNQAKTMPVSESAYQAYFYKEVTSIDGFFSFGALCIMFLTKEQRTFQIIACIFYDFRLPDVDEKNEKRGLKKKHRGKKVRMHYTD
jgi:hypothetical protein